MARVNNGIPGWVWLLAGVGLTGLVLIALSRSRTAPRAAAAAMLPEAQTPEVQQPPESLLVPRDRQRPESEQLDTKHLDIF